MVRQRLIPGDGPLARVSPVAAFAVVAVVFTIGVLLRGLVGAALLGLLAAGLVVLLVGSWHRLSPGARVLRLLVIAALIAITASVAQ